jgi:hypothetical protein
MIATKSKDTIVDEVQEIRARLYNEVKNLSVDERVKFINGRAEKVAKEYGIKFSS